MAGRALLLAGAPGTGKTALALGIAQVSKVIVDRRKVGIFVVIVWMCVIGGIDSRFI
jgi:MoxR-like ATPase